MKKIINYMTVIALGCLACTVTYNGSKIQKPGIYECRSKINSELPVFKFDSRSEYTKIHVGSDNYIEFYDLNSHQIIQIRYDSNNYECEYISEH